MRWEYNLAMMLRKRWAVVWGLAVSAAVTLPADDKLPLTLGFYLVADCSSAIASLPMQEAGRSARYCLERTPIVDQRDVASAAPETDATGLPVRLSLTPEAAQRWFEVSGKHIGLKIGAVLDGRLISVAKIAAATRSLWVDGLSRIEARWLIEAFQRRDVATAAAALPSGRVDAGQPDEQGIFKIGKGVSAPVPIYRPPPEYTEEARAAKLQGTVVLKAVVRPDGTPDMVRVVRSFDAGMDANAVACVRSWRFRPALKDGAPVPVWVTIEVNFRL
jgi:TonB family protein